MPAQVPPSSPETPIIPEDRIDLEAESDEDVPVGGGFVYDDEVLREILNDRFGTSRSLIERQKRDLVGSFIVVSGQKWTVRGDVLEDDSFSFGRILGSWYKKRRA